MLGEQLKRGLQKQAGGNPVIIPDGRSHTRVRSVCWEEGGGGEWAQPASPLLCWERRPAGGRGYTSPWGIGVQGHGPERWYSRTVYFSIFT